MTDYKPGTVAKATVLGVPDVTMFCTTNSLTGGTEWALDRRIKRREDDGYGYGSGFAESDEVTDVRPLVVLDLDWAESVPVLIAQLRGAGYVHIADQIEAQTKPRVAEPLGLGAVVEGREGNRWVRTNESSGFPWRKVGSVDRVSAWALITSAYEPVAVLSEGVTA